LRAQGRAELAVIAAVFPCDCRVVAGGIGGLGEPVESPLCARSQLSDRRQGVGEEINPSLGKCSVRGLHDLAVIPIRVLLLYEIEAHPIIRVAVPAAGTVISLEYGRPVFEIKDRITGPVSLWDP